MGLDAWHRIPLYILCPVCVCLCVCSIPKDKLYPRLNVRITHLIKFQRENSFSHFPLCHFIFPKIWFYHSRVSFMCHAWPRPANTAVYSILLCVHPHTRNFVCHWCPKMICRAENVPLWRKQIQAFVCKLNINVHIAFQFKFVAHCWLVCSVWPHGECTNAKYMYVFYPSKFKVSDDAPCQPQSVN